MKVIELSNNSRSARKIALDFGIGKTQVQNILKRKAEVLHDYANPGERKAARRVTPFSDINELCWDWFQDAAKRSVRVTGPMIKQQALRFAKEYKENTTFKASNGWLDSFLRRHDIVCGPSPKNISKDTGGNQWVRRPLISKRNYTESDFNSSAESGLDSDTTHACSDKENTDLALDKLLKKRKNMTFDDGAVSEEESHRVTSGDKRVTHECLEGPNTTLGDGEVCEEESHRVTSENKTVTHERLEGPCPESVWPSCSPTIKVEPLEDYNEQPMNLSVHSACTLQHSIGSSSPFIPTPGQNSTIFW